YGLRTTDYGPSDEGDTNEANTGAGAAGLPGWGIGPHGSCQRRGQGPKRDAGDHRRLEVNSAGGLEGGRAVSVEQKIPRQAISAGKGGQGQARCRSGGLLFWSR